MTRLRPDFLFASESVNPCEISSLLETVSLGNYLITINMADVSEKMAETKLNEEVKKVETEDDDFVDPWSVSSKSDTGIDYDKLIRKFYSFKDQMCA